MSAPDFWDDPASAQKVAQEVTGLKETVSGYEDLACRYEDLEMLWQLGMEESDESVYPEVIEMLQTCVLQISGAPGWNRTSDPWLRRAKPTKSGRYVYLHLPTFKTSFPLS